MGGYQAPETLEALEKRVNMERDDLHKKELQANSIEHFNNAPELKTLSIILENAGGKDGQKLTKNKQAEFIDRLKHKFTHHQKVNPGNNFDWVDAVIKILTGENRGGVGISAINLEGVIKDTELLKTMITTLRPKASSTLLMQEVNSMNTNKSILDRNISFANNRAILGQSIGKIKTALAQTGSNETLKSITEDIAYYGVNTSEKLDILAEQWTDFLITESLENSNPNGLTKGKIKATETLQREAEEEIPSEGIIDDYQESSTIIEDENSLFTPDPAVITDGLIYNTEVEENSPEVEQEEVAGNSSDATSSENSLSPTNSSFSNYSSSDYAEGEAVPPSVTRRESNASDVPDINQESTALEDSFFSGKETPGKETNNLDIKPGIEKLVAGVGGSVSNILNPKNPQTESREKPEYSPNDSPYAPILTDLKDNGYIEQKVYGESLKSLTGNTTNDLKAFTKIVKSVNDPPTKNLLQKYLDGQNKIITFDSAETFNKSKFGKDFKEITNTPAAEKESTVGELEGLLEKNYFSLPPTRGKDIDKKGDLQRSMGIILNGLISKYPDFRMGNSKEIGQYKRSSNLSSKYKVLKQLYTSHLKDQAHLHAARKNATNKPKTKEQLLAEKKNILSRANALPKEQQVKTNLIYMDIHKEYHDIMKQLKQLEKGNTALNQGDKAVEIAGGDSGLGNKASAEKSKQS